MGNPDIAGPEMLSTTATSFNGMLLVPGGAHEVGANLKDAGTYNQHPKFRVYLRTFWIDRTPVLRLPQPQVEMNVKLQTGKRSGAGVGVAFGDAQAYCESQNKRLPTEFEWEVGAGQPGFAVTPGVLEWTASPYEPYPGNVIWEPEYEQNLLVLRGVTAHKTSDLRGRFFLSSARTMPKVGFRCVRDAAAQ
jgi:formylglycine-generating enzyme required for sulfatase activity